MAVGSSVLAVTRGTAGQRSPRSPHSSTYAVRIEARHAHLGLTVGSEAVFEISTDVPGLAAAPRPGEIVAVWHKSGFGPRLARVAEGVHSEGGASLVLEVGHGAWAAFYFNGLRRVDRFVQCNPAPGEGGEA